MGPFLFLQVILSDIAGLCEFVSITLVCVRYRYHAESRQRLKTVELIVERSDWTPPPPRYAADSLVPLHIEGYESELRAKVKAAGGRWNPEKQLWFVKSGKIIGTQLEKHIQVDEKDSDGNPQKRLYVDDRL